MKHRSPPARLALAITFSLCFWVRAAYPFAVATPTTWATEAATEILRRGGNAADAMVAASFALNVSQPYAMGIGGGGFFLASQKDKTTGKIHFWDHREMAPASAHEKMFHKPDGTPMPHYPDRVTGPNPVGVPGTPLGLYVAHRKLGRLPWKDVVAPAVRLAREGFPLTPKFAERLAEEWERIRVFPATAALFGDGEGGPLKSGRTLRNPLLAQTLQKLASKGSPDFYSGELARSWISEAQKMGVKLTLDDLKHYEVRLSAPVEFRVFGLRAFTAPPPSAAGLMVASTLRYLESYYRSHDLPAPDSAERIIVTTEALMHFQQLRNKLIGDAPYGKLEPRRFLGSPDERAAWAEIDKLVAARLDRIQTKVTRRIPVPTRAVADASPRPARVLADASPRPATLADSSDDPRAHTAHLSIADDQGMVVSYTTTIEEWFGSGIVVPGHGFLLNNELSDFTAEAGHPNSALPGKRPRSNMSPLIFFEGNQPVAVLGCAGGGRIPTALVELLENYYLHKMSAREAIAFPRFHFDLTENKLEIDKSVPQAVLTRLKLAGYDVDPQAVAGTAQALMRRSPKDPWEAATEPRSDGMAIALAPGRAEPK